MSQNPLPDFLLEPMVRAALHEDLGQWGDITSRIALSPDLTTSAHIVARDEGRISGLQVAVLAFRLIDPQLQVELHARDGDPVAARDKVLTVSGNAQSILSAERVALNFAGRLSAIATKTAQFVEQAKGTDAKITCTRKTTPGLRLVEKLAVQHGGGSNHRVGLGDAIMIKDNHIAAAGGIGPVLQKARENASHMMRIEIEVDRLDQLQEVLQIGTADVVLLDNMNTEDMAKAVKLVDGQMVVEASGNMRLERIREVAATGVDYISVGALTHSVSNFDLGLDI